MDATRVSRGFHRLALFLAAIPLLIGGYFSVIYAVGETYGGVVQACTEN